MSATLQPWQLVVDGTTPNGPRSTVVDTRPGAVNPSYILRLEVPIDYGATVTTWVDDGSVPQAHAQTLPDLVSNVTADYGWLWFVAIGAGIWWLFTTPRRLA